MQASDAKAPPWYAERARILQRFCLRVESAVQRGQPATRTIRRRIKWYNGRPYCTRPEKKLRLSANRGYALFFQWRRRGSEAFRLHYKNPAKPKVTPEAVRCFLNCCQTGESFLGAYRLAHQHFPAFSPDQFRRALSAETRRELGQKMKQKYRATRQLAGFLARIQGSVR